MADWTANSNFGAFGRREPVVRASREAAPRADGPRAERFGPFQPEEVVAPRAASAALAEYNAAQDGPLAKARIAVWAGGGIVSLALIAGIGVWGYKLVLREVMGLPVIVAEEGPMRVLPADPEGNVVPQQGLAVNAIPAAGIAAPPSDVLMLAPQTPGLAEEDLEVVQTTAEADEVMPADVASSVAAPVATAALTPAPAAVEAPAAVAAAVLAPVETAPMSPPTAATPAEPVATVATLTAALAPNGGLMTEDEVQAFADQIAGQATPLTALPPAAIVPATTDAAAALVTAAVPSEAAPAEPAPAAVVAVIPATIAGVAAAPRPQLRPARVAAPVEAAPTAPAEAAPAVAASEAAPVEATSAAEASTSAALTASVPAGTHLVQLGAFDSAEIAASEWTRLQGRFGEFLGSRERVIQETESGGRTFYRLRAQGFEDRADARRLCAALTAEGADCIPVTVD